MKPVVFLPEAEQEMIEAAKYYELQASGLGVDYLSEVERAVQSIECKEMGSGLEISLLIPFIL